MCTFWVTHTPTSSAFLTGSVRASAPPNTATASLSGNGFRYYDLTVSPVPDGGSIRIPAYGIDCPSGSCATRVSSLMPMSNVVATAVPDFEMEQEFWNGACGPAGRLSNCSLSVGAMDVVLSA